MALQAFDLLLVHSQNSPGRIHRAYTHFIAVLIHSLVVKK
jgi:hypothetical protein